MAAGGEESIGGKGHGKDDASTTSVNPVLYSGRQVGHLDWMLEVDEGYEVSQIRRVGSTDGVVNKGR